MPQDEPSAWLDGLPYRLWRANQALHQRIVNDIEDLGVTVTQLGICVHLDELGHMSASDLARLFRLTPQSVTTALNHLEKLGWVTRLPHPVHKRVIWYELTEAGLAGADEGRTRVAAVNHEIDAVLDATHQAALRETLTILTTTFDGVEVPIGTMWPVTGSR
ncbi:MarR family winged helix-turn-helix transcriptional regulator [Microbacterium elymi]|uniref:MarR family transcriptional regulator n=1 Tax=Microbacterium elymi TaxID=2909587 RepID=A0ABY5NHT8_9MICO|nr:MarR family transcriptional regulator [Microbacterium elymi]UUT34759.1 MarR family transcriptional regulator [Microbacterium elymi]